MKLEIGSYVQWTPVMFSKEAFGFITKIKDDRYTICWIGQHSGIVTSPPKENLIVLAQPSKLTNLLFL